MLKNIKLDLEVLEMMIFFWQSCIEREKVSEDYLVKVATMPQMDILYDDEFNAESVRKVLSAITNREVLNTTVTKDKQFWNNNMWMTEDPEIMNMMTLPLKIMNLDSIIGAINEKDFPFEKCEVIVVPAFKDTYVLKENILYLNFFKVIVDIFGGTGDVTIEGVTPQKFICDKLLEMVK